MKKSEEYKIAERRQNFRNSIPGIEALEVAKAEQAAFDEAYNLALKGFGKYPDEPESDLDELEAQYPMAVALLYAEMYRDSANAAKAALGQKAVDNILDGADWALEVEEMKKQWNKHFNDVINHRK